MSIYEQIGGAPSVNAAVELFYDKVLDDPGLAPYFSGVDLGRLKGHQRLFITAALGGPAAYAGRDMDAAHSHLGIDDRAFDSVIAHLVDTLVELGVDEPTIDSIGAALAPLRADIVGDPAKV